MKEQDSAKRVIVWADSRQIAWCRDVVACLGDAIKVVGIGGERNNDVVGFADELGCEFTDDLRQLLIEQHADYLLNAIGKPMDLDDLATACQQGVAVLSPEPFAATLQEYNAVEELIKKAAQNARLIRVPAFVRSEGYLSAANPQEVLGVQRIVRVANIGRVGTLSLFARLYDAWFTALRFVEMPGSVDASLVGALGDVPEQLNHLTGTLSCHARLFDNGAALIQVSDRAGQSCRSLHVLGDDAELTVGENGYDLRHTANDGDENPAGGVIDHVDDSGNVTFIQQVAAQWQGLMDEVAISNDETKHEIPNGREVLACCLATLLSARTGQPESPKRALEMG
ncbi:hypothetical protein KS4_16830 [Poriferisphaera corsica]|uniref:Gfo/Idh/MocA-like oxidoreductase N-terminal domain-containing protein n=1 Tax=Poriferisphaera corsica TaxID=2528020 RepID=A0A517YTU8_9BACT|nr:hypothetical protein [Poriferisphaera corsica]QDU33629.1 hypothetical protein KS4_16830 [Poriferisphaera corsica]